MRGGQIRKRPEKLQKAVALGYSDMNWLTTDDSIDLLRKENIFKGSEKKNKINKRQLGTQHTTVMLPMRSHAVYAKPLAVSKREKI